jgi:hypothetical protein
MRTIWPFGRFALMVSAGVLFCACTWLEGQPLPGGPPRDSDVVQSLANSPGYSLALLCDQDIQCDARTTAVAARGWAQRLHRLGLTSHKNFSGNQVRSATLEGLPFTITVSQHVEHPGSPSLQYQAHLAWGNPKDAERGKGGLLGLESTHGVKN